MKSLFDVDSCTDVDLDNVDDLIEAQICCPHCFGKMKQHSARMNGVRIAGFTEFVVTQCTNPACGVYYPDFCTGENPGLLMELLRLVPPFDPESYI